MGFSSRLVPLHRSRGKFARDFYDTESMLKAWMNSPTHRDNIINSKYQEIDIGVVNGVLNGVKTTLVVHILPPPLPTI